MSSLRVMHVIPRLSPTGGAEVSLSQVLPELRSLGINNHVVALREHPSPAVASRLRADGFQVDVLEASSRVSAVRSLRSLITRVEPDVVHATLYDATVTSRFAGHSAGVPVVCSVVNTPSKQASSAYVPSWKAAPHRALDGWLARHRTHAFHAITQAVAREAGAAFRVPAEKFTVIPRGRSRAALGEPSLRRRNHVRELLNIPPEAAVVLNVGRQERQKGQALLVEAFARFSTDRPDALLIIAGRSGSASAELESAVRKHSLENRVRILGARDDVADLFVAADVCAVSSLWEGLGGAVLEAMALNTPVIAFDIPPVRETLNGTGFLVPIGSAGALAHAMGETFTRPEGARARADAARQRFDASYEIGSVALAMSAWYAAMAVGHVV